MTSFELWPGSQSCCDGEVTSFVLWPGSQLFCEVFVVVELTQTHEDDLRSSRANIEGRRTSHS